MKLIVHCIADLLRLNNVLATSLKAKRKPLVVEVKPYREKRTVEQNALLWKWLTVIAAHYSQAAGKHYSSDEFHEFFRRLFLTPTVVEIDGKVIKVYPSTTGLNIDDMSKYLEKIKVYCFDNFMLDLSDERL